MDKIPTNIYKYLDEACDFFMDESEIWIEGEL
jgi:hypothetical protein